ncbi:potassium channel family protein [Aestuariivirga sp.]|uniref:potassium channel family protein n=1 Tax=Aestuariivirga sp. TaxID=2650926 RepID=UPI003594287A
MDTKTAKPLKERLEDLYEGDTQAGHRFRYGLLIFDVVTITFIVASSFLRARGTEILDAVIGVLIIADFLARLWIAHNRRKMLLSPFGILDLIVIVSLMAPIVGEGFAFLRVARVLRLFRSYQVTKRLRQDFKWFRRHEDIVLSALNLVVFLFCMTAIVYETQHSINPEIGNYGDALYFTVTALTTTGFGDIVLKGTWGRLTAVVIMIFGVSLFLRLVQVMLRPDKVNFKCPDCGLLRHERDAVHCKACGRLLNIPDEGDV